MGPQLDSCGRLYHAGGGTGRRLASMGPQLDSCGRDRAVGKLAGILERLQWGRNLTVAEGPGRAPRVRRRGWLQWGRNLTVAEGGGQADTRRVYIWLQWGRNLTVAEGCILITSMKA